MGTLAGARTLATRSHLPGSSISIFLEVFCLTSWLTIDWRSSGGVGKAGDSRGSPRSFSRFTLTQEDHTLAVEDQHQAVLELGGQVEGEPGPGQPGPGRGHLLQHIVHDVVTAREEVGVSTHGARRRPHGLGKQLSPGVLHVHLEEIPARNSDGLRGDQPATHTATGRRT